MARDDQLVPPECSGSFSWEGLPAGCAAWPERLALWPLGAGRYGLDATFRGHWGCEDAEHLALRLERWGMPNSIRPEADDGWTVRVGPLHSLDVARALCSLIR